MKAFEVDLHIHTCLSPCADVDMSPKRIVQRAVETGLDIIAVTDHNSAENAEAAVELGNAYGVKVFPGMEINTREEVHVLAIFESMSQAIAIQDEVYQRLEGENDPSVFGDQVVANASDEVEGFNTRLLIGAVDMGVEEVVERIHDLEGLCIASHVDRPSFSIISQLGFVPRHLGLDALEISRKDRAKFIEPYVDKGRYQLVCFSDSHNLRNIGTHFSTFFLEQSDFTEVLKAFRNEGGRRIEL